MNQKERFQGECFDPDADYLEWLKEEVSFRLYEATDAWLDENETTTVCNATFTDLCETDRELVNTETIDSVIYRNIAKHKKASMEAKFSKWLKQGGQEQGCSDCQVCSPTYNEKAAVWDAHASVETSPGVVKEFALSDSCDGFEVVPAQATEQ